MTKTAELYDEFKLTSKQEEAVSLLSEEATFILLYGGSRSTKTFTLCRTIAIRAMAAPGSRHLISRFRFNHVKTSIIHDTFPKMMSLCFPGIPYNMNKTDWFAEFPNGSQVWFGGLDDKERTEKVLGNEYATIFMNECSQMSYDTYLILITRLAQKVYYTSNGVKKLMRNKFYCDENPPSKGHWTYKLFIDKRNPLNREKVSKPENYISLLMNPYDNLENLPESYIDNLQGMPKRQRDRFYHGIFGDDTENALWSSDMIEKSRINGDDIPEMVRVVVAVDPSGADDQDNTENDAIGIVVGGLGTDGRGYVLEDVTIKAGPATWGAVAASAYNRHKADRIVGEANYGGAMVEFVLRASDPNISYKSVSASRGTVIRAEPISALHDTDKIRLVGRFDDLEDELMSFTTTGFIGSKSPNRADAFIWLMTELFPGMTQRERTQKPIQFQGWG